MHHDEGHNQDKLNGSDVYAGHIRMQDILAAQISCATLRQSPFKLSRTYTDTTPQTCLVLARHCFLLLLYPLLWHHYFCQAFFSKNTPMDVTFRRGLISQASIFARPDRPWRSNIYFRCLSDSRSLYDRRNTPDPSVLLPKSRGDVMPSP